MEQRLGASNNKSNLETANMDWFRRSVRNSRQNIISNDEFARNMVTEGTDFHDNKMKPLILYKHVQGMRERDSQRR